MKKVLCKSLFMFLSLIIFLLPFQGCAGFGALVGGKVNEWTASDVITSKQDWELTVKKIEKISKELDMDYARTCKDCPVSLTSGVGHMASMNAFSGTGKVHSKEITVQPNRASNIK